VEEYRMARPPAEPSYFFKPPSSLSAHGAVVVRPKGARFLNYEGELAVVIGRRCRGVSPQEAASYIGGYTVANDWGVHDFRHADRGSMMRVKGQDGFCPMGPFLVEPEGFDPYACTLRTWRNGEVVQEARIGEDLMFSIEYMIADLSRFMTLEAGDVLLTGTPAHSRPAEPGDVVAVEITGIGRLENRVVEADDEAQAVGEPMRVSAATLHVALAIPEDEAERMVSGGAAGASETPAVHEDEENRRGDYGVQ
ncbi:MAG: fumarylacetoacetate hydrolase family protein, partial [Alicyclobacillus sp.]|nr:fumarylacetoacetate hydrolase family protein [Alicyclobacillus sp.]